MSDKREYELKLNGEEYDILLHAVASFCDEALQTGVSEEAQERFENVLMKLLDCPFSVSGIDSVQTHVLGGDEE